MIAAPASPSVPPLVVEIDGQVPLTAIAALLADRPTRPGCVLLESSLALPHLGRYSYLSSDPVVTITCRHGRCVVRKPGQDRETTVDSDPFRVVASVLAGYRSPRVGGLPPFQGGAIGHFGYDLGKGIERLPNTTIDDLHLPDLNVGVYDWVLARDELAGRDWVIAQRFGDGRDPASTIDAILRVVNRARAERESALPDIAPATAASTIPHDKYLRKVERATEYIRAGDIYQVCLSHRLSLPTVEEPLAIYRRLRAASPASYGAFLGADDYAVASISPEMFLRLDGRSVETRPIKGTRPRAADPATDVALHDELAGSSKDRAENLMIVDLLRNDLGRVCEVGSIRVPTLFGIESHATVHHMVSAVRGELRSSLGPLDLLRACFPGGSVTGCPKIRAMQIIDELEPTSRSVYCGAIGFVGMDGGMEMSIAIRTAIWSPGRVYYQVGGAIVADSDPEAEYQETIAKAQPFLKALNASPPAIAPEGDQ